VHVGSRGQGCVLDKRDMRERKRYGTQVHMRGMVALLLAKRKWTKVCPKG
jgi:hypothetical protein